ncbi:MAG TPA: hypothetical protein ENJ64_06210 [Thiotrichales bacterium]|nr:hypothetical protein [Thiotrichales bacterium]
MNRSRQALAFSLLYSLPLLTWFIARLHYIEWQANELQWLFRQTQQIVVLLQAVIIPLLFIQPPYGDDGNPARQNQPVDNITGDLLAILQVLLYPLPLLTLVWLSGATTLHTQANAMALVAGVAAISLLIQQGHRLVPASGRWATVLPSLTQMLLLVSLWHFRDDWFTYLGL